jgi:hypothetical protein
MAVKSFIVPVVPQNKQERFSLARSLASQKLNSQSFLGVYKLDRFFVLHIFLFSSTEK